ncbi:hypothetical protein [Sphingomonas sp. LT1P40]|uniref:hypothetical protein n=1 Tax=Alteristakelama amylovorans TaxID=3096166 RepID=UPI002FCC88AE
MTIDSHHARIRPITRLLAELQTSITANGVRTFDGRLDRFVIYTLATRVTGLPDPATATIAPTSVHALAQSLGRPYETIRRHVTALVADGLCHRAGNRINVTPEGLARPAIAQLLRWTHDCFARFVEDLKETGVAVPETRRAPYHMATGVRAAADIMLAVTQTNREKHAGWLDLVLFSTVVAGNCRGQPLSPDPSFASHPVSALAAGRTIGVTAATANRHCAAMVAGGQLVRVRGGFLVNPAWLSHPTAQAVTDNSLQNVRRLLGVVAAAGFPFDDPASAYCDGRPPLTPII